MNGPRNIHRQPSSERRHADLPRKVPPGRELALRRVTSSRKAGPSFNVLALLARILLVENRVELNPSHIRVCDIRLVAAGAFGGRCFGSPLIIWQRMMAESEVPPAVCLGVPLGILDAQIDAVELAVEKSSARRFLTGAIWKSWIENSSQLLYEHRPLWKGARLQICIEVLLFDVHMMEFRKVRLSVVEAVGRCRGSQEDPFAKDPRVRLFQLALSIIDDQ